MKLKSTFVLSAALLCGGMVNPLPCAAQAVTEQTLNQAEKELRGADGDVRYSLTRLDDGKYSIVLSVVADDKDTELMRILNSGKPVNVSALSGKLFGTRVVDKQKLRGTVVAKLQSDPMDLERVAQIAAAGGETLRLGAEGFALVQFPTGSDKVMPGLDAMLAQYGGNEVVAENTVIAPVSTPAVTPEPAVKEKQPEQPKPVLQGTPFKLKNENGLFKVEGTKVETTGSVNGNMLRVQESLLRTRECKTAAMNMSTGGLYIYSSNGYCTTSGLPKSLIDVLRTLNVPNSNISEVALSESNKWVVIYEKSGYKTSSGLPKSLLERLAECNAQRHHFKSIVLLDDGTWVVVTNKGYWCEGEAVTAFLKEASDKSGGIQAVHVTPAGSMLAVCKRGVVCNNVPATVTQALKILEFEPKVVKFTDDGRYIITDGKSKVEYNL